MKRIIMLVTVAFLFGGVVFAQENPKFEITGDYSYFRSTPSLSSVWDSQNLNGGGGDITFFPTEHFGIKADFQGYNNSTQCPSSTSSITGCASGNLFTYMFGPVVKYRVGKLEPFGEVLFGGAHSNFYVNACNNNSGLCSASPTSTAFTMAVGGGVDLALTHRFAVRLFDVDYVPTRFTDNFIGGNSAQNNFRFQAGVQFRF
jgi:opacity protein-like surface antigen